MASNLNSVDDVETLLSNLEDDGNNIIFIDEIHRMPMHVEEVLYPVMEDFVFEKEVGTGRNKKIQQFWVPKFTLIGATTLAGNLSRPLRDRFGLHFLLQNYDEQEICSIVRGLANNHYVEIEDDAIVEIAKRAKGVARIAINFFFRCKEYADFVNGDGIITYEVSQGQFDLMGIDEMGLDENDYKVLKFLAEQPSAIGIDALATGVDIDKNTVASIIEPYLMQKRLIVRTRSGRAISDIGENWICRNDEFAYQDSSSIVANNAEPTRNDNNNGLQRIGGR
jgi:Holliday junction DNA helicase RuvB